jgi:hypothetical protein
LVERAGFPDVVPVQYESVQALMADPSPELPPTPPGAAAAIRDHAAELEAVIDHLLGPGKVEWERDAPVDAAWPWAGPWPGPGLGRLERLLLWTAVDRARSGDRAWAGDAFRAAGGGVMVDLEGRFHSASVATSAAGVTTVDCRASLPGYGPGGH